MSKFPVYLSFKETNKYFDSLKSIDDKIEFYDYIVCIYEKAFSLKSVKAINTYIDKYKFRSKLKTIKDELPLLDTDSYFASKSVNQIYINSGYVSFHNKVALLYTSYSRDLTSLRLYKRITGDDFKLVFNDSDLISMLNSFNNKVDKYNWVKELNKRTYTIWKHMPDRYMIWLYKKYNLINQYPLTKIDESIDGRSYLTQKYSLFRKYLIETLGTKLSALEKNLEMDIKVELVLSYSSLDNIPDEEKFFLWGFKFDSMHEFSERAFPNLAHRIEYYSYAVSKFHDQNYDLTKDNFMKSQLIKIETRLNYLKTKYDLRKDRTINMQSKGDMPLEIKPVQNPKAALKPQLKPGLIKNSDKPIWIRSKSKLIKLLELLQDKNFIDDKTDEENWKEQYLALFKNTPELHLSDYELMQPVIWNGELSDLVYLVKSLNPKHEKHLSHFHKYHYWKKLSNVLVQNSCEPLNNHSLSNYKYKLKEIHNKDLIDEIIRILRNFK